ncbi:MAG: phosphatase PAP2 family protein [Thermoleophilia bacterium]|nr:phosphatase PAP2 family protein [Thermoleophilia bacterium]
MTAAIAAGRRMLPKGYADLGRQVLIWFGFLVVYQVARGMADRSPAEAIENGLAVIDFQQRLGALFEVSLQGLLLSSSFLQTLTSWTYWLSQFVVLGFALLYVYLRRNGAFLRFRNTILAANVIGLLGYIAFPTAPPRMFPEFGFVDVLANFSSLNHGSAIVELASNPYAAMPSLHAADSLIVGLTMAVLVRRRVWKTLWLAWPAWVAFCVMATGNHFWLDIAAGAVVAALAYGAIALASGRSAPARA